MRQRENQSKADGKNVTTRRNYLRGGLTTGVGLALYASGSASVTAAEYQTVTVPAGQVENILVDGNQTHENTLYDVTADGAGVTFRLKDNATVKNVGIKGKNQTEKFVFRIGGQSNDITLDRVYTECFDPDLKGPGGIVATKNATGTLTIRGASIHGWGNNGLYASKADAHLYVEDCYFTNNRTANYRGGGNYHGNNRDAVFRNCVCVLDDLTDVPLYPLGGNRTVGFIARWGEIEMYDCDMYLDPDAPDPVGTGTISDNSYCIRTDEDRGDPAVNVYDSNISPRDRISGTVNYVENVGSSPSTQAPDYAPLSAEDAASGYTNDTDSIEPAVAVSTGTATDVTDTAATLNGELTTLDGVSSAEVAFEYRQAADESWTATPSQMVSSTGSYSASVAGLSGDTKYEYRAVATAGDGVSDNDTTATFLTTPSNTLEIDGSDVSSKIYYEITVSDTITKGDRANDNDKINGDTAIGQVNGGIDTYQFSGEITDIEVDEPIPIRVNGTEVDLRQYETSDLTIDGSDVSSKVAYEITVSDSITKGDNANANDEVNDDTAIGQVNGGIDTYQFTGDLTDVRVSDPVPITVDGTEIDLSQFRSAPVIDRFDVSEAGSKNPHANIIAEWDVSDEDRDLSSVTVTVLDDNGTTLEESTTAVNGTVAYDVDYFELKNVDGQTFEVRVTVTDAAGATASMSRTVQE